MTTTTAGAISFNYLPTRKEIIQRLFEAGHISFDEMWVLIQEDDTRYIISTPYTSEWNPDLPYTYTQGTQGE